MTESISSDVQGLVAKRRKRRLNGNARHVIKFLWPVEDGYEWIDAKPVNASKDGGRYLIGSPGRTVSFLKPLEAAGGTGLFRNFAFLKPTEQAIVAFAEKFGALGIYTSIRQDRERSISYGLKQAEAVGGWETQIHEMRRAVELWDAIKEYRRGELRRLRQLVEWKDQNSVAYHDETASTWIATADQPDLLERIKFPDLVEPAKQHLQRLVNGKLREFPSITQLLWSRNELRAFIKPQSLIGAMWLQLALAIEGDRNYRICEGCGRWFEVGGGQKRSDSETCGPSCRKRRERSRKLSREKRVRRSRKGH